jgi:hypothetical protein
MQYRRLRQTEMQIAALICDGASLGGVFGAVSQEQADRVVCVALGTDCIDLLIRHDIEHVLLDPLVVETLPVLPYWNQPHFFRAEMGRPVGKNPPSFSCRFFRGCKCGIGDNYLIPGGFRCAR